ncbi:MAG: hypothetical protein MJ175_08355, partial [Clostridia bacterium]|nr:hypothetical protein [Clostridia bacterium]
MGLFSKKDPAEEYRKNKKAYLDRVSGQKNSDDVYLSLYKAVQEKQTAELYVKVTKGRLQVGDFLEIEYRLNNKLGVNHAVAPVKTIFQVLGSGGFGKHEERAETTEAYENDMIWICVPDVDVSLIYKTGMIRKSKAKNVTAEDSRGDAVSVSYDEEVSKMVNYFKNELYGFFAERKTIGHITQDLGYSLTAQRKRLIRMGITMTIEKSSEIGTAAVNMDVRRYSSSQYDVAEADEPVKLRRTYRTTDRVIYEDNDWR